MLIKAENIDEALKILSKAISIDPKIGAAFLNRGVALLSLGHLGDAVDDFTKATELLTDDSEKANAFLNRGNVFKIQNLHQEAADDYRTAASLYKDITTKAKCHTHQAYSLVLCNLPEQALVAFNNSIELNPSDFEALSGRALLHQKQGNLSLALKDWKLAILYAPDLKSKVKLFQLNGFKNVRKRIFSFFLIISFGLLSAILIIIKLINY